MCNTYKRESLCSSRKAIIILVLLFLSINGISQDGNAGIQQATDLVKQYFVTAQTLLYAIGGVVGIVGAVKVYNKWSHGDQDTNKTAAAWFGACIFLVVVATVLKAFFNL